MRPCRKNTVPTNLLAVLPTSHSNPQRTGAFHVVNNFQLGDIVKITDAGNKYLRFVTNGVWSSWEIPLNEANTQADVVLVYRPNAEPKKTKRKHVDGLMVRVTALEQQLETTTAIILDLQRIIFTELIR